MKKNLIYILSSVVLFLLQSCGLEEINVPEPGTSNGSTIEFVARPTYYDEFNVATKVTSNQINDLENKIYTAFFMLYDNDGNRVLFKDLTSTATSGGAISHTVVSDKGLSNATACFLANVSTDYAKSLKTVADLKGDKPLNIEYAPITSECIGIPLLTDASKSLDKVYSIPMAGVKHCDLSAMSGSDEPIQVPLDRLFAKFIINLSVDLRDDSGKTPDPQKFTLSNFVVNNIPTKVAIMKPDKIEDQEQPTKWSESTIASDYLQQDNVLTYFNLDDGADDSNIITTKNYDGKGQTKSLFFYAPEHIVLPDIENTGVDEAKQYLKPTLFNENSPKKPLYVSIIGDLVDENANDVVAKYDIYLGANNFDDFTIGRNIQYTNNLVIKGTEAADNRVTLSQGFISVSFKRATYLDSHFEVRPLRVKWVGKDENGTPLEPNGTVTVQILDAYDDNASTIPSWIRLERPSNPTGASYCGTIGKRKYFTTDLVTSTLAGENGIKITYPIDKDANGEFPVWVYVDEYVVIESQSDADVTHTFDIFKDATRQARIRVQFTPEGETEPSNTIDYVVTQRSVYPVVATNQEITEIGGVSIFNQKYIYGIEYFEEYLYNYDDPRIQDSDGFSYDATQDGMEWGLDGVQLSHNNRSVNLSELKLSNKTLNTILNTLKNIGIDLLQAIEMLVNSTIDSESLPFYDFYISSDNVGGGIKTYSYDGISMNKNILNLINSSDNNRLDLDLNQTPMSVIEYCFNKNKRNSDGEVEIIHWYAPAIDEIEDITISSYEEFDVFQNKLYWSCQPAFHLNRVSIPKDGYTIIYSRLDASLYGDGTYQIDNINRARATKIDGNGKNISSGVGTAGYYQEMVLTGSAEIVNKGSFFRPDYVTNIDIDTDINTNNIDNTKLDPGNLPRTGVKNRVRCVYSKEGIAL